MDVTIHHQVAHWKRGNCWSWFSTWNFWRVWSFIRAHLALIFARFVTCFANTVYPKKYAHGFCFAVLGCGYTLTDFPISIRLTSLALWQSNDCPSASKATLMNMDKYFMWIHYERLHNTTEQSTTKPCAYFLGYTVDGVIDHTPVTWNNV